MKKQEISYIFKSIQWLKNQIAKIFSDVSEIINKQDKLELKQHEQDEINSEIFVKIRNLQRRLEGFPMPCDEDDYDDRY